MLVRIISRGYTNFAWWNKHVGKEVIVIYNNDPRRTHYRLDIRNRPNWAPPYVFEIRKACVSPISNEEALCLLNKEEE